MVPALSEHVLQRNRKANGTLTRSGDDETVDKRMECSLGPTKALTVSISHSMNVNTRSPLTPWSSRARLWLTIRINFHR